ELGLKELGITDHGFAHRAFGLKRKKVPFLIEDCRRATQETGVKVLVGMEANILGESGKTEMKESDYQDFDLFIAGKHVFVAYESLSAWIHYFGGNFLTDKLNLKPSKKLIERTTKAYINTIKNNPVDIISHVNYLCFADSLEVAKCAADYGTYIEINTKKTHLSDEEWQNIIDKTSARFVIDSDAHAPARVGDTRLADELFSRISFPMERIDNIEGRVANLRLQAFKAKL
ncbi:MAG: PHP domain-containing protein, partial [Clostridia bacterium]|nr:PHP domain-containing protein [Clostridia bacterium]